MHKWVSRLLVRARMRAARLGRGRRLLVNTAVLVLAASTLLIAGLVNQASAGPSGHNMPPGKPSDLSPHLGQVACGGFVGTASPTVQARYVDANGDDTLSATFQWRRAPHGSINVRHVGIVQRRGLGQARVVVVQRKRDRGRCRRRRGCGHQPRERLRARL